jgi:hypothetical protein
MDQVLVDFSIALYHTPNPILYFKRASLYYKMMKFDAAYYDVVEVLKVQPEHVDALLMRSEFLLTRGDHIQALGDLDFAVAHCLPTDSRPYLERGKLYYSNETLKNIGLALKDFKVAAQKVSQSGVFHLCCINIISNLF